MKIAFGKHRILFNMPINLGGFAYNRLSEKMHDSLFIKVILFKENKQISGIIVIDVIAIDELFMEKLQIKIQEIGLNIDDFIISAIHTHSGPNGTVDTYSKDAILYNNTEVFGEVNYELIDLMVDTTINLLNETKDGFEEFICYKSNVEIDSIGKNRNDINLDGDNSSTNYLFKTDKKQCMLINYACHPTVLNFTNKEVSADLFGAICTIIENDVDLCVMLNGACGDISCRFTKKSSDYKTSDFMANSFKKQLYNNSVWIINNKTFNLVNYNIDLVAKTPDSLDVALEKIVKYESLLLQSKSNGAIGSELRQIEAYLEGARANLKFTNNFTPRNTISLKVSVLNLFGDVYITFPGEIYSELTNELKYQYNIKTIGYANGYCMYLTDKSAFDNELYEASSSPFAKGEGERFIAIVKTLI